MRFIEQQAVVNIPVVEFKDMARMLWFMDNLANSINTKRLHEIYNNLPKDLKCTYERVYLDTFNFPDMETVYDMLRSLGFESTVDLCDYTVDDLKLVDPTDLGVIKA